MRISEGAISLDGAIPLPQMDDIAVFIAQDLKFNMVRPFDIFLDENAAVAEGRLCFARGNCHILTQLLVGPDDPQAATPAAGAGLDHNRVVDTMDECQGLFEAGHSTFGAWHDWDARLLRNLPRLDLAAHQINCLGRRTNEGNAGRLAEAGEICVF